MAGGGGQGKENLASKGDLPLITCLFSRPWTKEEDRVDGQASINLPSSSHMLGGSEGEAKSPETKKQR